MKSGERGFSADKSGLESGSGLGLYHARTTLESWGGSPSIVSKTAEGTTVTAILPRAESPKWFVPAITAPAVGIIAVLDDDVSIHEVWYGRFQSAHTDAILVHFSSPDEFEKWHLTNKADLYLVDCERPGFERSDLDMIEQLGICLPIAKFNFI
jgi:hypothetical protein